MTENYGAVYAITDTKGASINKRKTLYVRGTRNPLPLAPPLII